MKILHIINDGADKKVLKIIDAQKLENEVKIVFLNEQDINYAEIIDVIETADKVFSWNSDHH